MTEQDYIEYAEQAFDNIVDALEQIELGKVTILTGDNGSGKSLIRKVLASDLKRKNNGEKVIVADSSMDKRTGLHSEMGGGGVFLRDTSWIATSSNTIHGIKGLFSCSDDRYIVLDEPEIGMSASMQMSWGKYINDYLTENKNKYKGVLIISHSKTLINQLTIADKFINIQKKTKEEWMNEEPEMIDIEEFEKKSDALYKVLSNHLK